MIIAACKYPLETLGSFSEFAHKQTLLLAQAKNQGAAIAVLPEYLALELAGFTSERGDLAASLLAIQEFWPRWQELFTRLAQQFKMWICAGTFLVADGQGRYVNRAGLFSPAGTIGWQDKILLTGFEKT
ncbi:MAG TPA: nitrilase, partial [Cellvibrionaceae bacterium]|nr:nitrilase [Cellvibrionaceae bacterium]